MMNVQLQSLPFIAEEACRANGKLPDRPFQQYQLRLNGSISCTHILCQIAIQYKAPTLSPIRVGLLEVNALTGKVLPLTINQIETMRDRARAYLSFNTP